MLISINTFAREIRVLGFHDIVDPANMHRERYSMDYSVVKLEEMLVQLIKEKYKFLSTDEFYARITNKNKNHKDKLIMLTFDDGYYGIYENLLPLLRKLKSKYNIQIKVVLFVNASLLGQTDNKIVYTDCAQLREGFKEGFFDVQSHGYTHRDMTELSNADLEFEASESKKFLSQCLQSDSVRHFAYPYGHTSPEVIKIISKYYNSAYLYNNKPVIINKKIDRYNINRLFMSY